MRILIEQGPTGCGTCKSTFYSSKAKRERERRAGSKGQTRPLIAAVKSERVLAPTPASFFRFDSVTSSSASLTESFNHSHTLCVSFSARSCSHGSSLFSHLHFPSPSLSHSHSRSLSLVSLANVQLQRCLTA